MSTQRARHLLLCPECGARSLAGETICWLCHQRLPAVVATTGAAAAPARSGSRAAAIVTTGIAIGVMLLCVVPSVFEAAPGLGIIVVIVLLPVFAWWTIALGHQRGEPVRPSTVVEKAGLFFTTLGALVVAGLAGMVTFAAICFPAGLFGVSMAIGGPSGVSEEKRLAAQLIVLAGLVLGPILGLYVFYRVLKRYWS